jgi:hypothetical protein
VGRSRNFENSCGKTQALTPLYRLYTAQFAMIVRERSKPLHGLVSSIFAGGRGAADENVESDRVPTHCDGGEQEDQGSSANAEQ